jgi:hypothetical protein
MSGGFLLRASSFGEAGSPELGAAQLRNFD